MEQVKNSQKFEKLKHNVSAYRHVYPEFLPDPKAEFRNRVREKLERNDMIARRMQVDIPEFYVGSIMAVTISDKHTPGKSLRFVGICIKRSGCGLRASFILRNVIDHQVRRSIILQMKSVNKVQFNMSSLNELKFCALLDSYFLNMIFL